MRIARRLQILRAAVAALAVVGLFGLSAAPGMASPALSRAPLNPAFKLYGRAAAQEAAGAAARGVGGPAPSFSSGLVPSPVDIGALSAAGPVRAAAALPASFDLRTASPARLSPVENQGSFGTCWAFASLGSLESAGWSSTPADAARYSEDNLALKSGYYSGLGPIDLYNVGGNSLMATAYLARWAGPVLLGQDAYGDYTTPAGLAAARHVQDVLYVPGRTSPTDNDGIKAAVMAHGAVYVAFYWGQSAATWQGTTHAYYDATSEVTNHAVDIVGWDDSYAASNFATRPPGNGAFIVRNSWGTSWGDGGYFHLSYYDANLALLNVADLEDGNAVFVAAQPADNYDAEYQYDPLGWTTSIGFGSPTAWFANRFTAGADGALKAVSFYAARPGSAYTVLEGTSTSALAPVASGTLDLAGYHTVPLDSSPALSAGAKFVVAVKLTTPGYDYPIPAEYPITDFYGYTAAASASPGQSYVSADGSTWTDLTTMSGYANTNVCLKAFADTVAAVDATPPSTTASGAGAGWDHAAVTLQFHGSDAGSGVARTEYRVDAPAGSDAAWTTGSSVTLPAPADHSGDGIHTVEYRSVDEAGNTETFHTATVRIDTRKPTAAASSATVKHGGIAALHFRVYDAAPSAGTCRVTLTVRSAAGATVRTFRPSTLYRVGTLHSYSFHCTLKAGRYTFRVRATDAAGNLAAAAAVNSLTVH